MVALAAAMGGRFDGLVPVARLVPQIEALPVIVEVQDPPPNQRTLVYEARIAWMHAHPGEWLKWGSKRYSPSNQRVASREYEKAYRKVDGVQGTYVRWIGDNHDESQ